MTDFEQQVIETLTRLETHMERIVGNGQPGILDDHNDRISALEISSAESRGRQSKGVWVGIGSAIVSLIGVVIHYFGGK